MRRPSQEAFWTGRGEQVSSGPETVGFEGLPLETTDTTAVLFTEPGGAEPGAPLAGPADGRRR